MTSTFQVAFGTLPSSPDEASAGRTSGRCQDISAGTDRTRVRWAASSGPGVRRRGRPVGGRRAAGTGGDLLAGRPAGVVCCAHPLNPAAACGILRRDLGPMPPEAAMPIATPEVYAEMLDRAKAGGFAYPAINV